MNLEELTSSGMLELYVMGALSQREALIVEEVLEAHPKIVQEIEAIEATLVNLTADESFEVRKEVWNQIQSSITGTRTLQSDSPKTNWSMLSGWAAAILFLGGIFWMLQQNNLLEQEIQTTTTEKIVLQEKIENTEDALVETTELLNILRSQDYREIALPGNPTVSPESFAKVYYNDRDKVAYIDVKGLPTPPEGKVYQVWSLIMDPLTPRSVGVLDGYRTSENKIFKLDNIPDPEAFGITLEPTGGSESPTLSQLYTLGMVTI